MNNKSETKSSILGPLLIAMSICFAILKLTGVIAWSWWIVIAPVLCAVGLWLLKIVVIVLAALYAAIIGRREK